VFSRRALLLVLCLLAAAGCVAIRMAPAAPTSPDGSPLPPCPGSPNCVCSEDPDPPHRIPPLAFDGLPAEAMARLRRVLQNMPRTTLVSESATGIRAECRTLVFRFVDDLEFRLEASHGVIQVRSASRIGYSDLGTNRRRVEQIRRAFAATGRPH